MDHAAGAPKAYMSCYCLDYAPELSEHLDHSVIIKSTSCYYYCYQLLLLPLLRFMAKRSTSSSITPAHLLLLHCCTTLYCCTAGALRRRALKARRASTYCWERHVQGSSWNSSSSTAAAATVPQGSGRIVDDVDTRGGHGTCCRAVQCTFDCSSSSQAVCGQAPTPQEGWGRGAACQELNAGESKLQRG